MFNNYIFYLFYYIFYIFYNRKNIKKLKILFSPKPKKSGGVFIIKNILVFFGGKSTEHDISVITGVLTLNCIDKTRYNAIPIYISRSGVFYTGENFNDIQTFKNRDMKKAVKVTLIAGDNRLFSIRKKLNPLLKVDSAINCMHGKNGEDGSISGLMRLCNIPLASPDMFASSFSMDKDFTKVILKGLDLPYVEYFRIKKEKFFEKSQKYIDFLSDRDRKSVV